MAVMEFPDYQKLYEEQYKQTESWRNAAEVLRETLRDQFAMQAMNAIIIGNEADECCISLDGAQGMAKDAYNVADAMLAARAAEAVRG